MKAKLNNKIIKYERERDQLSATTYRTVYEGTRLQVVNEILRVLYELRN